MLIALRKKIRAKEAATTALTPGLVGELVAACEGLLDLSDCDPKEIGGVEKLAKDRARAVLAKFRGEGRGEG